MTPATRGRIVEIGTSRERVEIIDEPTPGPNGRIGRLRHANGENVAIAHATLARLIERASEARAEAPGRAGDVLMA